MLIDTDSTWTLLPPIDVGHTRVHKQVDMASGKPGERWLERYTNVNDLARRLAVLELLRKEPHDPRLRRHKDFLHGVLRGDGNTSEGYGERLASQPREDLIRWSRLRKEPSPGAFPEWAGPLLDDDKGRARLLRSDDLQVGVYHDKKSADAVNALRVLAPGAPFPVKYKEETSATVAWLRPLNDALQRFRVAYGIVKPPSPPPSVAPDDPPCWVEDVVIRRVIRALLSRPLVLLAGVSGSGKTLLASHLGRAWASGTFQNALELVKLNPGAAVDTAIESMGNWCSEPMVINQTSTQLWRRVCVPANTVLKCSVGFVPVQSDWTDARHLWGYHVPLPAEASGFYATRASEVFLDAWHAFLDARKSGNEDPWVPAFLLLDEMNLSRPEHYGADLLSAMEKQGEAIIQLHRAGEPVPMRGASQAELTRPVPSHIGWAKGLRVLGTVNVDETTFSFAPKVLDRAALLEFVHVDLNVLQKFERISYSEDDLAWLTRLNDILRPYNLHIAYRAAIEILQAIRLDVGGGSNEKDARDAQILNKVLPRIRGTRAAVEDLLIALHKFSVAEGNYSGVDADLATHNKKLIENPASFGQDRAVRKIIQMYRRAQDIGFTSFFG